MKFVRVVFTALELVSILLACFQAIDLKFILLPICLWAMSEAVRYFAIRIDEEE